MRPRRGSSEKAIYETIVSGRDAGAQPVALTIGEMPLHDRLWRSASLMAPCNLRPSLGV